MSRSNGFVSLIVPQPVRPVADEPLVSLDSGHPIDVIDLLVWEACHGALVVAVLHDLRKAARHCDRLLLMDGGANVAEGTLREVLTPERLRTVCGISATVDSSGAAAVIQLAASAARPCITTAIDRRCDCPLTARSPEGELMQPLRDNARVLTAATVGTAVEYFDFFIYATAAALVFGPLFFPSDSEAAQTLLAFVSFAIAFLARPIGAVAFGHFGDRLGRKSTLVASLLLMGISTVAIGFLPTYQQAEQWGAGWIAPLLLCLLRFGQGFGLGGEWAGAALLAVENAPEGWEGRFGAAPPMGIPLGFVAANGLFLVLGLVLDPLQFNAWGWRIPFFASSVLIGIGLWGRLKLAETPAFREALAREAPVPVPIAELLRRHLGAVAAGSAGVVLCYAVFYLGTAFALAEATGYGYPRETFLAVQLVAALFLALGTGTAAYLTDQIGPRAVLAGGAGATILLGLVFGAGLAASLTLAAATVCVTMFVMGFTNAPLGIWLARLFPVRVRYSGVAFSFNLGGIVGGGLTPVAAQMMSAAGAGNYTGLLLAAAAAVTVIGIALGAPRDPAFAAPA